MEKASTNQVSQFISALSCFVLLSGFKHFYVEFSFGCSKTFKPSYEKPVLFPSWVGGRERDWFLTFHGGRGSKYLKLSTVGQSYSKSAPNRQMISVKKMSHVNSRLSSLPIQRERCAVSIFSSEYQQRMACVLGDLRSWSDVTWFVSTNGLNSKPKLVAIKAKRNWILLVIKRPLACGRRHFRWA